MLDQRRRRLADVVQMLYKWFVFAGKGEFLPGLLMKEMDIHRYDSETILRIDQWIVFRQLIRQLQYNVWVLIWHFPSG